MTARKLVKRGDRFDPVKQNKRMNKAWKILGFEGSNPNLVPEPETKETRKKEPTIKRSKKKPTKAELIKRLRG